ncbi:TetR/AcrR family transcriptional regulator [Persicimonas caeni]|uniref:TetR/AcrR family transcriptional regulator n=1 Tax=Persicimonas caeni TaxID=2292766 RepID=A0A4Y6PRG6_PERCE|nr:TetR/AcrR family transcriptional regulator [Persicimonas caeni]QDG50709.1 TetR/AcrR family transcriptional regulator [Persicimonas caeni]QED31930.1 TetR/AcrR family transcriptional regulator [Persicimonas caeni]
MADSPYIAGTTPSVVDLVMDLDPASTDSPGRVAKAAVALFARRGYSGTTIRDIAARANVTLPVVYYHFGNKEALFLAIVDSLFERTAERIEATVDAGHDIEPTLRRLIELPLQDARTHPDMLSFAYTVARNPSASQPAFDRQTIWAQLTRPLADFFERAHQDGSFTLADKLTADFVARQVLGMISNSIRRLLESVDAADDAVADAAAADKEAALREAMSEEHIDRLVAFFLRGAGRAE